jgi:hypothetical protein
MTRPRDGVDDHDLALSLQCLECGAEPRDPCRPGCLDHQTAHEDGDCSCADGAEPSLAGLPGPLRRECPECGAQAGSPCPTAQDASHLARVIGVRRTT